MLYKVKLLIRTLRMWLMKPFGIQSYGLLNIPLSSEISARENGKMILYPRVSVIGRISLTVSGGNLIIGKNSAFNRNCQIACRGKILIGENCQFGPNVVIYDHNHCFNYEGVIKNAYSTGSIIIEDNCWIGANVTLLKDTFIGEGSVIGAGVILKGTIPPHSLVIGNRKYCIVPIDRY